MRYTSKLTRAMPLMIALAAITACQETNSPDSLDPVDARAVLSDYDALDSLRGSAGWKGFQMAAPQMNARLGIARRDIAVHRIPLISESNLGKTFVYDSLRHEWVADQARTGAPANGVRFITYAPRGAEPDASKPIGHADLIDLGHTTAGIALRLIVVEGPLTIVDYHTTLEATTGTGHVAVAGFIQNTRDKLDFDIDVRGQSSGGTERADIDFEMGIAARDFAVTGNVNVEKQNGGESGAVDLHVRHGAHSFVVDVVNTRGTLDGDVALNNSPFAIISGPAPQPVFKKPGGESITGAEALVLWRIFDVTEDVFDLFEDLIDPIDELVIWAAIL